MEIKELQKLIEEMEDVMSKWNGDESGYAETRTTIANDIIEKSKELIALINELNGN